jgi:hypothetical protein
MNIDPKCEKFILKFCKRIKEIRTQRMWTLEKTEEEGWPNWRHLQRIESGKNVTLATVYQIGKLYKVHPSDLLKDL